METLNTKQAQIAAFITVFRAGGFQSYKISLIIANAVFKVLFGKGLSFAANRTLVKSLSIFTGPIGWAITGIWTAFDIAGTAYRVTIPAVIQVAFLRFLSENKALVENEIKEEENI